MAKGIPTGHGLSSSSINCYEECPRKYMYRYVDRAPQLPMPQKVFVGSIVHKALEVAGDRSMSARPGEEGPWGGRALVRCIPKDSRYDDETISKAQDVLLGCAPMDFSNTVAVEYTWRKKLWAGGPEGAGIIDRVDIEEFEGGTRCRIIDYKASPGGLQNEIQAGLYLLIAPHIWPGHDEYTAEVWYLMSGKRERIVRTPEGMEALLATAKRVWAGIRAKSFAATPGGACKWCNYRDRCPDHRAWLADADPTNYCSPWAEIAEVVQERQRLKELAEIADQGRRDLDDLIRARLEADEPVKVPGYRVALRSRRQEKYQYIGEMLQTLADMHPDGVNFRGMVDLACRVSAPGLRKAIGDHENLAKYVEDHHLSLQSISYVEVRRTKK